MSANRRMQPCTWIFRAAAVCLIVLAALPFTAPFSTYDPQSVLQTGIEEGGDVAAKLAANDATAAATPFISPSLVETLAIVDVGGHSCVPPPRASLLALRL